MKPTCATSRRVDSVRLPREFYLRPTLDVARDLLGKYLVRVVGKHRIIGRIAEVEAYIGEDDPACHARFGPTDRNRIMYGKGGFAYVYFIYGMHNMFNVVTERPGRPAAVLLRALEPVDGIELMMSNRDSTRSLDLTNGPGKLCQAFAIDTSLSGADLTGNVLYLSEGEGPVGDIGESGRIGIRDGNDRPWRFFLKGNPHVSK
jgi:DNA-3-methyladenine glycosylase